MPEDIEIGFGQCLVVASLKGFDSSHGRGFS